MAVHVYPIDDIDEHRLDTTCNCGPTVDFDLPELLVVHNSFDGREDSNGGKQWKCEPLDEDFEIRGKS